MSVWDFPTIEDTIKVFRAKWMPYPFEACVANTHVENFVNELFFVLEDRFAPITDIPLITVVSNDQLKTGEALISKFMSAGVPAEDILLAMYVGSDVVEIKRCHTFNFIHKLAKRFLETHPAIQIPAAFLYTAPEPWRPIVGDDWDECERHCHKIGMQYLMVRAAGLNYKLPWCPTVVPASYHRAPKNDVEDNVDVLMTSDACDSLLHHYTMVILNSVYV